MTHKNRLFLRGMALAVLAFPAAAGAQAPGPNCASDDECGAGQVCVEGVCEIARDGGTIEPGPACDADESCAPGESCMDGACVPSTATACEADSDCAPDETCMDGMCMGGMPTSGTCAQDADCGDGERCLACMCVASEGICMADADCAAGQVCQLFSTASAGSAGGNDPAPAETCSATYGYCAVDVTQVPANPLCQPFCETLTACADTPVSSDGTDSSSGSGGTGTGTATAQNPQSTDALAECVGYCSYLLGDATASQPMQDFVTCVTENTDATCEALATACQAAADAVGTAAGDVPAGVATEDKGSEVSGGGTGTAPESQSAGDLFQGAFGGGGAGNGSENADAGVGTGADAGAAADTGSSGGCTIGMGRNPGALGAIFLALASLGAARRRR